MKKGLVRKRYSGSKGVKPGKDENDKKPRNGDSPKEGFNLFWGREAVLSLMQFISFYLTTAGVKE